MGDNAPTNNRQPPQSQELIQIFYEELESRSRQKPESLRKQLEEFSLIFTDQNRDGVNRSKIRDEFEGGDSGFLEFLNELMLKSFGSRYNWQKGKFEEKNSQNHLPTHVNCFDLVKIAQVQQHESRVFPSKGTEFSGYFVDDVLHQVFNPTFNETNVCTKNRAEQTLAEYQDAADPLSQRLRVTSPSSLLEASIIECEQGLLIEGVHGTVGDNKEEIFDYLYSCLVRYAHDKKNDLLFNLSFNPNSQRVPIEFVNYVARRNKQRELYEIVNGSRPRKHTEQIKGYELEISAKKIDGDVRHDLEEKLQDVFKNPNEVVDGFATEKRYADTWWPSNPKPWNMREGKANCLTISHANVAKEYKKITQRSFWKKVAVAGSLVATLVMGALGYHFTKPIELGCKVEGTKIHCEAESGEVFRPISTLELSNIQRVPSFETYDQEPVMYKVRSKYEARPLHISFEGQEKEKMKRLLQLTREVTKGFEILGSYRSPKGTGVLAARSILPHILAVPGITKDEALELFLFASNYDGLGDDTPYRRLMSDFESALRTGNTGEVARIKGLFGDETVVEMFKDFEEKDEKYMGGTGNRFLVTKYAVDVLHNTSQKYPTRDADPITKVFEFLIESWGEDQDEGQMLNILEDLYHIADLSEDSDYTQAMKDIPLSSLDTLDTYLSLLRCVHSFNYPPGFTVIRYPPDNTPRDIPSTTRSLLSQNPRLVRSLFSKTKYSRNNDYANAYDCFLYKAYRGEDNQGTFGEFSIEAVQNFLQLLEVPCVQQRVLQQGRKRRLEYHKKLLHFVTYTSQELPERLVPLDEKTKRTVSKYVTASYSPGSRERKLLREELSVPAGFFDYFDPHDTRVSLTLEKEGLCEPQSYE